MQSRWLRSASFVLLGAALAATTALAPAPASAQRGFTKCQLSYDLVGWSFLYKTGRGNGRVVCDNGQRASVRIETRGGGITFGSIEIVDGQGTFSGLRDISEIYGAYATAEAHAGAGASVGASVVVKDDVSLALASGGRGINVGFAFGSFRILKP